MEPLDYTVETKKSFDEAVEADERGHVADAPGGGEKLSLDRRLPLLLVRLRKEGTEPIGRGWLAADGRDADNAVAVG